jgi:uncharacterized circularly permuted ATP-grasp superfamily protein
MPGHFHGYHDHAFHDEMLARPQQPRAVAQPLFDTLERMTTAEVGERRRAVEAAIDAMGITFTVYREGETIDRHWPLDLIPRIIAGDEWTRIHAGLCQRLTALNRFIDDLYGEQAVIRDGVLPAALLEGSRNFREACRGVTPAYGVWAHIAGSDLVRDAHGTVHVLEDNLRVPSGVSYMLENRHVMKRIFPELFANQTILPVDDYCSHLLDTLGSLAPADVANPEIVVLTPGIFNAAYFEHSYLAQQMGAELVEGRDLFVGDDECVYMRTIAGPSRVDVIYRRIDDDFLDPEVFRADSTLGVRGLMRAWRAGNVAIANAPGAGVADDKAIYAFMPEIIRYYTGDAPLLANVPTWRCLYPDECAYVLDHLDELVVKPANESGGYGMLIGPRASNEMRRQFARLIREDPRNYIAQPMLGLSTVPTLIDTRFEPRHVDLRPFVLHGRRQHVTTGGLSRVAMRRGSLVVNSSQGGGSKDTWVVDTDGFG